MSASPTSDAIEGVIQLSSIRTVSHIDVLADQQHQSVSTATLQDVPDLLRELLPATSEITGPMRSHSRVATGQILQNLDQICGRRLICQSGHVSDVVGFEVQLA